MLKMDTEMDGPWDTSCFPCHRSFHPKSLSSVMDQGFTDEGFLMTVGRDGKECSTEGGGLNHSHNFETLANKAHLADALGTSVGHISDRVDSYIFHLCVKQGLVFSSISALMAKAATTRAAGAEPTLAKAGTREISTQHRGLRPGSSCPHHFREHQASAFLFPFSSNLLSLTPWESLYEWLHLHYASLMPRSTWTWFFRGIYYPICTINTEITSLKNKQILPGQRTVLGLVGQSEPDTVGTTTKLRNKKPTHHMK